MHIISGSINTLLHDQTQKRCGNTHRVRTQSEGTCCVPGCTDAAACQQQCVFRQCLLRVKQAPARRHTPGSKLLRQLNPLTLCLNRREVRPPCAGTVKGCKTLLQQKLVLLCRNTAACFLDDNRHAHCITNLHQVCQKSAGILVAFGHPQLLRNIQVNLQRVSLQHVNGSLRLRRRSKSTDVTDNKTFGKLLAHHSIARDTAAVTHSAELRAYSHTDTGSCRHLRQLSVNLRHRICTAGNSINEKRQTQTFA